MDADELYNTMKQLDLNVSKDEVEKVLSDVSKDGTHEIDFDEFLYAMAIMDTAGE